MKTVDFVEIELGGDSWKITWDDKPYVKRSRPQARSLV